MRRLLALLLGAPVLNAGAQDCSTGCAIPDEVGICTTFNTNVTEFPPGQVIQDASAEIDQLFVNMEHSYMGDLIISFICPNGQSILVHDQGGTNTFLGEPVDNDADPNTPGVGYDYSWDPSATNGTWENNAGTGTLPAGAYESYQSFTNLNGCPLNGSWQIEICDLLGSDNGFVFDFGINFSASPATGCTDPSACNYNPSATDDDGSCAVLDECGVCGGQGIPEGFCDCLNQPDATGQCGGDCDSDINNNGVCDDQEVLGCTYPVAENYNPEATDDNGSCTFPQCEASDEETCAVEGDFNGDGIVGTGDLLAFLALFGSEYQDSDGDGLCDELDDCFGVYDECGVCAGPGAIYECGCNDLVTGNCDCDGNQLDALGICGGSCVNDEDGDGVCDSVDDCVGEFDECGVCNGPGAITECGCNECNEFASCGDAYTYHGHDYETVQIGGQCWFAENLRTALYSNGDSVLTGLSRDEWWISEDGAYGVFGDGGGCSSTYTAEEVCIEGQAYDDFGFYYNRPAVIDPRNVCPSGWHVPTNDEWNEVINHLGGGSSASEAMRVGGSNASGFSSLPAGGKFSSGNYGGAGNVAIYWSSTPDENDSWDWAVWSIVSPSYYGKNNGYNIRCIQDEP